MQLRVADILAAARGRLRDLRDSERGFTMIATLGVMVLSTALVTAAFVAADSDINSTQHDLQGKRADLAARAGVNEFVHKLNQDPTLWQSCPTQPTTTVPGSTPPATYSYKPVAANGAHCTLSDPIGTMIDTTTGTFSMQFTGTASGTPAVTRSVVASFKRPSPLDFLWYTVYETLDPSAYFPFDSKYNNCANFHRSTPSSPARPDYCRDPDWIQPDVINGPMYTQDQYRICGTPTFGRPGRNDAIEAAGQPPTYAGGGSSDGCDGNVPKTDNDKPVVGGQGGVPLPTVNSRLQVDAGVASPMIFGGQTTIRLSGSQMFVTATAESTDDGKTWTTPGPGDPGSGTVALSMDLYPVVYVASLAGCTPSYTPFGSAYPDSPSPPSTACGIAYVQGNYSAPLTIATSDDIVVTGAITTTSSGSTLSGPGMLGLVATNFVRVKHEVTRSTDHDGNITCGSEQTRLPDLTIDAAILALSHSFIVDNYDCGGQMGTLTVNGAIAQRFRGLVGTHSGSDVTSGYAKDYTYDDRLKSQQPPYLFDIQNQAWKIFRETACISGGDCGTS